MSTKKYSKSVSEENVVRSHSVTTSSSSVSSSYSTEHEARHHDKVKARGASYSSRSSEASAPEVIVNTIYADASRSESIAHDPNRRRVVRRVERQAPRLIHHEEHILEGGKVLKQYQFDEQVPVEYTAVREDVVEHLVAVPVTEEEVKREKIPVRVVEIEKKIPVQKVVEVPQVEVIEQIKKIPTPSGRVNRKINYVPIKKVVPQERKIIVERPVEQIIEVPDITYVDVEEVIETVEVPEYQDVIRVKEVKVPTVVEIPKEHIEERDDITDVELLIPVGVEAHTKVKYTVPTIVERRTSRGYPVYVPRFIEVPTNSIQLTRDQRFKCKKLLSQMKELEQSMHGKIVSVCEVEKMGVAARDHQTCIQGHIDSTDIKNQLLNVFGNDHRQNSFMSTEQPDHATHHAIKAKDEGYYGHTNVTSQWNHITYELPTNNSRRSSRTRTEMQAAHHASHRTEHVAHTVVR